MKYTPIQDIELTIEVYGGGQLARVIREKGCGIQLDQWVSGLMAGADQPIDGIKVFIGAPGGVPVYVSRLSTF